MTTEKRTPETFLTNFRFAVGHCHELKDSGVLKVLLDFASDAAQHHDQLKADLTEAVAALEKFFGWLESGLIVRDITKDQAPDWPIKMMHFVKDLTEIQALTAKLKG